MRKRRTSIRKLFKGLAAAGRIKSRTVFWSHHAENCYLQEFYDERSIGPLADELNATEVRLNFQAQKAELSDFIGRELAHCFSGITIYESWASDLPDLLACLFMDPHAVIRGVRNIRKGGLITTDDNCVFVAGVLHQCGYIKIDSERDPHGLWALLDFLERYAKILLNRADRKSLHQFAYLFLTGSLRREIRRILRGSDQDIRVEKRIPKRQKNLEARFIASIVQPGFRRSGSEFRHQHSAQDWTDLVA